MIYIFLANGFEEVSKKDKDAVKVSIFQYASASKELGNKVHYLCKTSSKDYEPLVLQPIKRKQIKFLPINIFECIKQINVRIDK